MAQTLEKLTYLGRGESEHQRFHDQAIVAVTLTELLVGLVYRGQSLR